MYLLTILTAQLMSLDANRGPSWTMGFADMQQPLYLSMRLDAKAFRVSCINGLLLTILKKRVPVLDVNQKRNEKVTASITGGRKRERIASW